MLVLENGLMVRLSEYEMIDWKGENASKDFDNEKWLTHTIWTIEEQSKLHCYAMNV